MPGVRFLNTTSHGRPFLPLASLLAAMAFFQVGASLAKSLFPVVGAEGTSALRLGLAAIVLLCALRPSPRGLRFGDLLAVFAYGLTLAGMNLLFYLALRTIPLGVTVAIEFMGPLSVAVLLSRSLLDLLWIALAGLGLFLLLPIHDLSGDLDPLGVVLALAAGGCWALYIVFGKQAAARLGTSAVAWGMTVAALVVFPVGVVQAGWSLLSVDVMPVALAVAIFSSALPFTLELFALSRMPARLYGVLISLEPALAALAGFALLHEQLPFTQWLAIGLVVAASAGATLKSARNSRSAPEATRLDEPALN
jgi:inner membrane transporter RhtA